MEYDWSRLTLPNIHRLLYPESKENKMSIPNFFIIGAPKCGTTALFSYLSQHPNVFVPKWKEPGFFCPDTSSTGKKTDHAGMKKYLQLFKDANLTHTAIGEGTVLYLYSKVAVSKILEMNPAAKFIVMLRNPVELVYSWHSELRWGAMEPERDFEKAWRLQDQRLRDCNMLKHPVVPVLLQYRDVGRLGDQVERLFNIVPREQVTIILLEDMKTSTKGVYEEVLAFLSLESDGRLKFPKVNDNKISRSETLQVLMKNPPFPLNIAKKGYQKLFRPYLSRPHFEFKRLMYKLNTKPTKRKPLSLKLQQELVDYFREDVEKLSQLIGRDLSHWCKSASSLTQPSHPEALGSK